MKGLTLYSQSEIFNVELLVCAGCADKLLRTYYGSTFHKGDDPATKEIYLAQIHPRVSIEEMKKDVTWNLKISPDLSETPHPTDEDIYFIRRFSPAASAGRELAMELTMANLMKQSKG
jgi:hypothetical protein